MVSQQGLLERGSLRRVWEHWSIPRTERGEAWGYLSWEVLPCLFQTISDRPAQTSISPPGAGPAGRLKRWQPRAVALYRELDLGILEGLFRRMPEACDGSARSRQILRIMYRVLPDRRR